MPSLRLVKVDADTPIRRATDEEMRASRTSIGYDYTSRDVTYAEDDEHEERPITEHKYISYEDSLFDFVRMKSNFYYAERGKDFWIVKDDGTVAAVIKHRTTVEYPNV